MKPEHFFTHSLRDLRVARILAAALDAVEPGAVVERYLTAHPLPPAGRVFALGVGKAAVPMTQALSRFRDLTRVLVITKHASPLDLHSATVIESGHPVPDERSVAAGRAALDFVSTLHEDDLLVCLISGGGSALMTAPILPLGDMQALTSALLASGARIDEINTLRRHLDRVKGGGIARVTEARVLSLILSDVVGSPLEAIASGPTAPDPTTREDALEVLEKYFNMSLRGAERRSILISPPEKILPRLRKLPLLSSEIGEDWRRHMPERSLADSLPLSILQSLLSNPETPKPEEPIFKRVQNVIVGDNALAIQAAVRQAEKEKFRAESLGSAWQGEAREAGVKLAQKLRVTKNKAPQPFCLIAGGEMTVTLDGEKDERLPRAPIGFGGRNQELALAAVPELAGLKNILLISLATDGEDGPTDAAGAVINGETLHRAEKLERSVADHLSRHDAYPFFEQLGDLLMTGPTGTNVNDLVFLLAL